jgi:GntR family transcriptional regulator
MQIESALRQRILSRAYPSGGRFPTDERLCAEFGVSRATVRLALDALHREGLIARYPGRGSFVNEERIHAHALRFEGSIDKIVVEGDGAGTEHFITTRKLGEPLPLEMQELELAPGQRVLRLGGFRMRDGRRLAKVVMSLPEAIGSRLDVQVGEYYRSIALMLREQLGLKICLVRQTVSAERADPETAGALDSSIDVPFLVRRRTFYGAGGTPLETTETSYPGDRYHYEVSIT